MDVLAFPQGLLDLLGARTGGKGFSAAADSIVPVVDITPMLSLSRRISARQQTNAIAVGVTSMFTVPQGKVWRVIAGSLQLTTGAGETTTDAYLAVRPANFSSNVVALMDSFSQAASLTVVRCIVFQQFMMQAGDEFVIALNAAVGNPDAYASLIVEEFSS